MSAEASDIDLLIEICEDHFRQRNYTVTRSPPLHLHVRWRPHIYAKKNDEQIALDVRLTDSIPKFFRGILKSAKSLMPELKIYMAIPSEAKSKDTYINQTRKLKIGLFSIDGNRLVELVKPKKARRRNFVSTPSGKRAQAIILRPGSRYSTWLEIGQVLSRAQKCLKVIDPYCEETTLKYFLHMNRNVRIQLITSFHGARATKEPLFRAACQQFKLDYPLFEVVICPSNMIHDRYFITESETWMLGPSAKDAGLKFGCLARIMDPQARTEIEKYFDGIWSSPRSARIV